jgi:hypothetical protein
MYWPYCEEFWHRGIALSSRNRATDSHAGWVSKKGIVGSRDIDKEQKLGEK